MSKVVSIVVFGLAIVGILFLKFAGALISWSWWRMFAPVRVTGILFGIPLILGFICLSRMK